MHPKTENRIWTYQDYLKMGNEVREIIYGELQNMTPAPSFEHQYLSSELYTLFSQFIKRNKLGLILYSPFDVILDDKNIVQPDITFIANEKRAMIKERGFFGIPDLLIEIVSPSSVKLDTVTKKDLYEKFGVKEYWIIFPKDKLIEVFILNENNKFEVMDFVGYDAENQNTKIKSKLLDGFELLLSEIFEY